MAVVRIMQNQFKTISAHEMDSVVLKAPLHYHKWLNHVIQSPNEFEIRVSVKGTLVELDGGC